MYIICLYVVIDRRPLYGVLVITHMVYENSMLKVNTPDILKRGNS